MSPVLPFLLNPMKDAFCPPALTPPGKQLLSRSGVTSCCQIQLPVLGRTWPSPVFGTAGPSVLLEILPSLGNGAITLSPLAVLLFVSQMLSPTTHTSPGNPSATLPGDRTQTGATCSEPGCLPLPPHLSQCVCAAPLRVGFLPTSPLTSLGTEWFSLADEEAESPIFRH